MVFQADGGIGKARKQVEAVIKERGVVPDRHEVKAAEGGAAWALQFGSAAVMIALNPPANKGEAGRLRVVSPLVKVSGELRADLLRRLLELNGTNLPGVAFGMVGDEIVLVAERSVRGLDRDEVEELLAVIGHFADEYDDLLVNEFGGVRVCDIG